MNVDKLLNKNINVNKFKCNSLAFILVQENNKKRF